MTSMCCGVGYTVQILSSSRIGGESRWILVLSLMSQGIIYSRRAIHVGVVLVKVIYFTV